MMNDLQLKELAKIKKLVRAKKRKFENRSDRNYLEDLLEIGISVEEAWKSVLLLSKIDYFEDPKPLYFKIDDKSLIFKKIINNTTCYIKLRIEYDNNDEMAVCLSFHKDFN